MESKINCYDKFEGKNNPESISLIKTVNLYHSNSLIEFEAKIFGMNIKCCVDTGATSVFMKKSIILKL